MTGKKKTWRAGLGLTQDGIVRSALTLIEAHGFSALSTRKLATVLGCEAMSLYYHFPNIDALQDAIVDALLAGLRVNGYEAPSPETNLRYAGMAYLKIADLYPHAFQLVATRRWHTPNALAASRSMVDAFVAIGLSPNQALGRARILGAYLNGAGMALSAWHKSDGKISAEVADELSEVSTERLQADSVRADLVVGLELLVKRLTAKQE